MNIDLKKYLTQKGIIRDGGTCRVQELSGGIINRVSRIEAAEGNLIVKQFLDRMRIDRNIKMSPKSFYYEKYAINYLDGTLHEKITPAVIFSDDETRLICMKDLGEKNRLDLQMISEEFDISIFSKIGRVIADIHNTSFFNKALPILFDNDEFHELKILHRYYKNVNDPSLQAVRDELIRKCRRNRITLIHNDLKPNNFFVVDGRPYLLDYEGVYYGDPAFDVGYFLGHLFLYYFHRPTTKNKQMILNFWHEYISSLKLEQKRELENNVIRHTGFIMMYKLTGIAKDDYKFIDDNHKERIMDIAKRIILSDITKVSDLFGMCDPDAAR